MAISWTDVTNVDASLSAVPAASQTAIITDVYLILSADRWGSKLDLGAKYLAAHFGAFVLRGGAASGGTAPVSSMSLGDASITYMQGVTSAEAYSMLNATPWGQVFKLLVRGLGVWAVVT